MAREQSSGSSTAVTKCKQLFQEETVLLSHDNDTGGKMAGDWTCFCGTPPALIYSNHAAPQESQLCPLITS